jgi:hypothetical protein
MIDWALDTISRGLMWTIVVVAVIAAVAVVSLLKKQSGAFLPKLHGSASRTIKEARRTNSQRRSWPVAVA